MANAINLNYFTRSLFLPNSDANKPEGQQLLAFIAQYEPEFLVQFFGVTLANLVQTEINTSGSIGGAVQKIVEGSDFVNQAGVTKRWVGLKNATYISPIANYIYYLVQQVRDTSSTGIGEMMQQTQNATRTSAGAKTTFAWNQMVDYLLILDELIVLETPNDANLDTYVTPYPLLTKTTRFGL
jgi:hypothetical protein